VSDSPAYDYEAVARALDIGPGSSRAERTIDDHDTWRTHRVPRRVRSGFTASTVAVHHGMPAPRNWYANVRANPKLHTCI